MGLVDQQMNKLKLQRQDLSSPKAENHLALVRAVGMRGSVGYEGPLIRFPKPDHDFMFRFLNYDNRVHMNGVGQRT